MEEKKLNEVFEFEGTTLQVVETEEMNCENCYFNEFCKKSPSFRWGMNCKVIHFQKKILFFTVFSFLVTIYI